MKRFYAILVCVLLCSFAASSAHAQADLGMKALGFELGLVSPENVDATFAVTGLAHFGTIIPNLALEGYMSFWSQGETIPGISDVTIRDIIVGGHVKYMFEIPDSKVRPFAGGGLAMHYFQSEVSLIGFQAFDDSEFQLGIDFGGGLMVPINERTSIIGEGWYTLLTDINQFTVRGGVVFNLQ